MPYLFKKGNRFLPWSLPQNSTAFSVLKSVL